MEHYSLHCAVFSCLITDPFDLNHNLGAGLSRKSRLEFFTLLCLYLSFSCFLMRNVISHHDSDQLYHEGLYQWQNSVWHSSDSLPSWVPEPDGRWSRACVCIVVVNVDLLEMWPSSVSVYRRSISLILKSSQREKWLLMTAAAASVARSDTSWRTAPCGKGGKNKPVWTITPYFSRCKLLIIFVSVFFVGLGSDQNIERTPRDEQNTCETKWTQGRIPGIRADTGVITGGREIHWRRAAATCVGRAPTSRRTASCTEALQVQFFPPSHFICPKSNMSGIIATLTLYTVNIL